VPRDVSYAVGTGGDHDSPPAHPTNFATDLYSIDAVPMYRFVVNLLEPHTVLSLLMILALFHLWRKRRQPGRRLLPLVLPLVGLTLVSNPVVAWLAVQSLECQTTPVEERGPGAEAVVVFAAGLYPPDGPRLRPELHEDTVLRCLNAARLYAQGPPLPVVVSGGKVDDDAGPTCAAVMGDLLRQLGVKDSDLVLEEQSQTTYENAVECAKILQARGLRRVVLVVDAVDMPRAAACLGGQGIEVLPFPCHYRATTFELSFFSFLPSPGAASGFRRAWHEWVGLLWYRLRGRL
jgi:uncharacterized SAM-binding protein YcdF (DUF218 family)